MTWRLRIGRFAPHVRRSRCKHRQDHGKRDEWKEMGMEWKSSSGTNLPSLRTNRTHAKVGFLLTLLYVAVVTMCATKSSAKMGNLHDLSAQILLGGDISPNPGPAASVQTEVSGADLTDERRLHSPDLDYWERCFRSLENRMQKKMKKMEKELKKQRSITAEIARQCEKDQKAAREREQDMRREMERLTSNVDTFASDIANKVRINEDQTDKMEGNLKKNNIKLFGIPEPGNEPYWNCLQNVLHLLREAMPGMTWSEKDLVKVQRLGPTGQRGRSRPVLVQMSTFLDKLLILRHARDALRSRGIRVSSELTSRQVRTLNDLRDQGHTAFYRNNRLWFQDDRSYSRRGNPRFQRGRFQGRQREAESYHTRTTHTAQHVSHDRWMHPDGDHTWGYQDHPPSGPQNQPASEWNEDYRLPDPPDEHDRNDYSRDHGEKAPPDKPSPETNDEGGSKWKRILTQISSPGDSSLSESDSDWDSLSCDDQDAALDYKCGGSNDQHSVLSQRSEVSQRDGSQCGANVFELGENLCADSSHPDTCTHIEVPSDAVREAQQVPSDTPAPANSGNHDPKRFTQTSVLDWFPRLPDRRSGTGEVRGGSERVQATSESEAGGASSAATPSVWHGRLRQNVAREGPNQADESA